MVSPEKIKALEERMHFLKIYEKDLLEKFVHSQGRGGQKLNKSSSCVWLKHVPSGIEVKCQKDRSQAMNRFFARRMLADKIEEMLNGKDSEQAIKREKLRRQKKKRKNRAKEKIAIDSH